MIRYIEISMSAEKPEDMPSLPKTQATARPLHYLEPDRPELSEALPAAREWLLQRTTTVVVDQESAAYFAPPSSCREASWPQAPDLALVLGGDGTLLSARARLRKSER